MNTQHNNINTIADIIGDNPVSVITRQESIIIIDSESGMNFETARYTKNGTPAVTKNDLDELFTMASGFTSLFPFQRLAY